VAACLLGVLSLLVNITTGSQLSGQDQEIFAIRRTGSLLLNSGTVWAGLSVLAGWLVRRPIPAALAGVGAGMGALVVHYALGETTGVMPAGSFGSNVVWFTIAGVTGAPLGLVGALSTRAGRWGVTSRLLVPLGAVLEPWVVHWWQPDALTTPAQRVSDLAAATILTVAGLAAAAWVIRVIRLARGSRPPS
jgi:hypothetical protein